jgi:CheY-like chemotaxis protein
VSEATPTAIPRGCGQIVMVVDDEPALVMLTEEVLAGLGYEPAGFHDPRLALDVLRNSPDRFDVLLTDQVMPGMTGIELVRELRAQGVRLPILLATGFGGAQLEQQALEAGVTALLQKPLRRGDLARQLAKVLVRS